MSRAHKPIVRINGAEVEGITDFTTTITLMPDGRHRYEVDVITAADANDAYVDRIADCLVDRIVEAMGAVIVRQRDEINREALGDAPA